jgi:uncharacterized protein (DUF1697 family)
MPPAASAPHSERLVALLRGVNVGVGNRVAMADLRALLTELGYGDPRTLLNSGNAVFAATGEQTAIASRIETALAVELGVRSRVTVLSRDEIESALQAAAPPDGADPSRYLLAFLAATTDTARLAPLLARDWGSESIALSGRVAYLHCPDGIAHSALAAEFARVMGDGVSSRNLSTVLKIRELMRP